MYLWEFKSKPMNDFQLDFTETSTETWKAQILKELKDDAVKIEFTDKIEEISLDITKASEKDFNSEVINESNNWNVSAFIEVNDEKSANKLALKNLNQGYNELIFNLKNGFAVHICLIFRWLFHDVL